MFFNLFQSSVVFHIETNHLICNAKQMTGFYGKCNTGQRWVSKKNRATLVDFVQTLVQITFLLTSEAATGGVL